MILLVPNISRAEDVDPEAVRRAIDGAVRYLKTVQHEDGSWQELAGMHKCGVTAFCTLALLNAGVPKEDPVIQKSLTHLRRFPASETNSTYTIATQCMVYALADPERDRALIREGVAWLEKAQIRSDDLENGGWGYQLNYNLADNSNSQFAVLGLYEAERVGIPASHETWLRAKEYWEKRQNANGSWGYSTMQKEPRGSMTCAGMASLLIADTTLNRRAATVLNGLILCCQPLSVDTEDRVEKGLKWLRDHFTVAQNPAVSTNQFWVHYYLYALERVGRLSAKRFIGSNDWYREGTNALLIEKGNFVDSWKAEPQEQYDHLATSFALLFLVKGRRPILVSKLQYGNGDRWNAHPSDLKHLTLYAEKNWKFEMSWQLIDSAKATADDLLQTPVLYFCGDRSPLSGNARQDQKLVESLRGFLEGGGFLFAEAYSEDDTFDAGFRELMNRVLPEEGYEFHLLDPSHPIWAAEKTIPVNQLRPIEGIDFGCRTSVVYVPPMRNLREMPKPVRASLSCLWELAELRPRAEPYSETIQVEINAGLDTGLNILAYATGRELKYKYEIPETVIRKLNSHLPSRGKIQAAMLDVMGSANAAPRAIAKLVQKIALEQQIPIEVRVNQITLDDDGIFNYPVLFLHGRNSFQLSAAQRERLKTYIDRGGFLFVNAICASQPFIDSFRREMAEIFPDTALTRLAANDPFLTDACGGYNLQRVTVRIPQKSPERRSEIVSREIPPELEGIRMENRWSIVFSPYDVSCALEDMSTMECQGYTQEDAFKLGLNAILYAVEFL
ncbi:MAG: DUF4159 domain-containing protein [Planctomycetaceae bacterium]|nr:DUF4159 domain-containing protein [Planctomycetaceae bacterium]